MTDITEMVQSIKAAAERATPGPWLRSGVMFSGITNISNPFEQDKKPCIAHASEKRDAEFIALANPANVLALLERIAELERSYSQVVSVAASNLDMFRKAESRIAELESIVNTPVKLPPFGFQLNPHSNSLYFPRNDFIKAIEEHGLTVQED